MTEKELEEYYAKNAFNRTEFFEKKKNYLNHLCFQDCVNSSPIKNCPDVIYPNRQLNTDETVHMSVIEQKIEEVLIMLALDTNLFNKIDWKIISEVREHIENIINLNGIDTYFPHFDYANGKEQFKMRRKGKNK